MKTTLFLLHATSWCWLAGATLSKTDAKKPHKAEVEVSSVGLGLCDLTCPATVYPHLSFVHSPWGSFSWVFSTQTSPADLPVLERGLVVSDPHWKDIVREEKRYCVHIKKTFQGQVLGYVTPVSPAINGCIHTRDFLLCCYSAFHTCNYSIQFFNSLVMLPVPQLQQTV